MTTHAQVTNTWSPSVIFGRKHHVTIWPVRCTMANQGYQWHPIWNKDSWMMGKRMSLGGKRQKRLCNEWINQCCLNTALCVIGREKIKSYLKSPSLKALYWLILCHWGEYSLGVFILGCTKRGCSTLEEGRGEGLVGYRCFILRKCNLCFALRMGSYFKSHFVGVLCFGICKLKAIRRVRLNTQH